MPRQPNPDTDYEHERLNTGAPPGPPQPEIDRKRSRRKHDAALPGSQNADLRGAKRDRKPKGAST